MHGAFAGFTGFTVGLVNTHYVYLPIPVIIQDTRKVDPKVRFSIGIPEPCCQGSPNEPHGLETRQDGEFVACMLHVANGAQHIGLA